MHDVLLVLPVVGPPHLYTQPESALSGVDKKWLRRLTRVPQGLLSIASYLSQNGISVKIFDSRLHLQGGMAGLEADLRREIKQTNLFVGISVLTMHIGEALQQTQSLEGISSLVYKDDCGKIYRSELAPPFDINCIGEYRFDLLELPRYTRKESYNPDREVVGIDYNGSRGCCYDCSFCINRILPQNHVWRGRKPELIVKDLVALKERLGIEYVFFEEELPFVDRARSFRLAELLKPLGLRWYANIRVDMVWRDRELLEALRSSGWCETSVGAESGSNRMLEYLHKGITVEQTLATAKALNELNVYCLYSFMTDLPGESVEEKMATFSLMQRLRRVHAKSEFIGPQNYRLYPKTAWYSQEVAEGRFKEPCCLREWVATGLSDFYAR